MLDPFYPIVDSAGWLARLLPCGVKLTQLRVKGDDKGQIEAKSKALEEAGHALFAAAAAAGQQAGGEQAGPAAGGGDDVVDAEFTEVKDDGNKQA